MRYPASVPGVGVCVDAEVPQLVQGLDVGRIRRGDRAALERRDHLDRSDAEARDVAEPPDGPAFAGRPEGVRGVLDDPQPVSEGDTSQLVEPAREAEVVDSEDRPGPVGHEFLDVGRVDPLLDVTENDVGTCPAEGLVAGDVREGRSDRWCSLWHVTTFRSGTGSWKTLMLKRARRST